LLRIARKRAFVVVPVAVLAAIVVAMISVANIARARSPALALRMVPFDAGAKAARADQLMLDKDSGPAERRRAIELAREALVRAPLSPAAMRVLAIGAELDGRSGLARTRYLSSARLSRRDFPTRIWLIEEAVRRDNVGDALDHFDIALRTSRSARSVLFPILSEALKDRQYVDPAMVVFNRRPAWMTPFFVFSLQNGGSAPHLALILSKLGEVESPWGIDLPQAVVDRMVSEGQYREAFQFTAAQAGDPIGPADTAFEDASRMAPFVWAYADESGRSARFDRGALRFEVDADNAGELARRLIVLPAGQYRLIARGILEDAQRGGGVDVLITCAGQPAAELTRLQLRDAQSEQVLSSDFRTPAADCSGQWLRVNAVAANSAAAVSGQISSIEIRPYP
jgi:hypothetical protein